MAKKKERNSETGNPTTTTATIDQGVRFPARLTKKRKAVLK